MSDDCIICRIVDGEIPARLVHEADGAVAFLDANPLAPGHTLVVPTSHQGTLGEAPADVARHVFEAVHEVVPRVREAVDAEATTVGINDGPAAGQEVPHLHVHVVPRFEGDGGGTIHSIAASRPELSDDELDDIAERIRGA